MLPDEQEKGHKVDQSEKKIDRDGLHRKSDRTHNHDVINKRDKSHKGDDRDHKKEK
jgi:hypothetical protein